MARIVEVTGTLLFATAVGCGAGASDGSGGGGVGGGSGPGAGQTSTGSFGVTAGGGSDYADDCAEASRYVYFLGKDRQLVRFYPPTLELETVATVSCSVNGGPAVGIPTPFSMSVDRHGTAWILYNDGTLHELDIAAGTCSSTDFIPLQLPAFELFGMGFVSDAPGSTAETLHIASYNPGDGLGTIDLSDLYVRRSGFYDKFDGPAELTGTGDGRLYGFFFDNPVKIVELDKTDARMGEVVELPDVEIGQAWAFAFWGGDFWLATAPGGNALTSRITRYSPSTGTTEVVVADAGLLIVGAGVSTCAPLVAPE